MEQKKHDEEKRGLRPETEEVNRTGGLQDASASRGGTTDMDNETTVGGQVPATERGSGISTKRNVTGSDFDGQPSV